MQQESNGERGPREGLAHNKPPRKVTPPPRRAAPQESAPDVTPPGSAPQDSTPEGPTAFGSDGRSPSLRLASLWQRLSGFLFDALIFWAASLLTLLATGDLGIFLETMQSAAEQAGASGGQPTVAALETISPQGATAWAVITGAYLAVQARFVFQSRQSIGKRIVGARIYRPNGAWANPWRIVLIRVVGGSVVYGLPLIGAFLWMVGHAMVFSVTRRALHDYLADTVVLDVDSEIPPG